MDPKTKKKLIIGISVTTIVGVGGYFLYKWLKDTGKIGGKDSGGILGGGTKSEVGQTTTTPTTTPVYPPPPKPTTQTTDRPQDVLAFQQWANTNGWTPKLDEDGLWGPKTKSAWTSKKSEYKSSSADEQKAEAGVMTGSIKALADRLDELNVSYTRKDVPTGFFLTITGPSSGNKYYFGNIGSFYAYDSKGMTNIGTQLGAGNWSDIGSKIVVTSGMKKGKTITGADPMKTAYNSVGGVASIPLSSTEVANIVDEMFESMDGFLTNEGQFMRAFAKILGPGHWKQVKDAYGTKDGENLKEWVQGDFSAGYRTMFNTHLKKIGVTSWNYF